MNLNYESDYKGTPVYTIEEIKFKPKRANRNFIYQGTSENLNLIFWDGRVNATGSDDQFIPLERQKLRKRKIG